MIHTTDNFFNKVATELGDLFFPQVKYYQDDEDCAKMHYNLELFNNGCLTYRQLIGRLSKSCKSNNSTIHNLVEKHVVSFGNYQYKTKH